MDSIYSINVSMDGEPASESQEREESNEEQTGWRRRIRVDQTEEHACRCLLLGSCMHACVCVCIYTPSVP